MPLLPETVQIQGVRVSKSTKNFLLVAGFVSGDGSMSYSDLNDYVVSNIQDPVSRVLGVGPIIIIRHHHPTSTCPRTVKVPPSHPPYTDQP